MQLRRCRMLPYAAVCCRMLPYAGVCKVDEALEECSFDAAVCYRMLPYCCRIADVLLTYAGADRDKAPQVRRDFGDAREVCVTLPAVF